MVCHSHFLRAGLTTIVVGIAFSNLTLKSFAVCRLATVLMFGAAIAGQTPPAPDLVDAAPGEALVAGDAATAGGQATVPSDASLHQTVKDVEGASYPLSGSVSYAS